ncbi:MULTISPECIES: HlyD family type I secretion periplasmic adaptor subunit [unclassified Variovorax]|uniref:HlyD family type I secretion periplasmic adaptor subunit n=1 Tax=unclassified Variovorax TaxID=663243 RepID=UPI00076BDD44|nr:MULTISPECIES: HlyD family type I secretion periplasmic adaptor subunit [unclassified Variovorax]KWT65079.1 HlyD family secretion protein [Variovorax sp. WDL1]PNG49049.1 Hemolysin secretion protein D, chromosomal [Variovorax sp. B2]PNG49434.1 Hemolysin secretion protein D, chromosomal [Variovorax sp. B4]VTV18946.1 Hemolysin secretion protein D, chromosomal [Variovorax sp. WDL1]
MNAELSTSTPAANAPSLRHPAFELISRYRAVFRIAWQRRRELAGPRRLSDEAAFLPAALSLQDTPVHPAPRRLAFALIALFLVAIAWSVFGQIDIVAVAPGRIVVSERTKVVQPLEVSVVKRILVKDGSHVRAGEPLVELDPTSAIADKTSVDEQLKSAQSEVLRTRVLMQALQQLAREPGLGKHIPANWTDLDASAARVQLADEWSDIQAKLSKAGAEIQRRQAEIATVREMVAKLETTLPIAKQREADIKRLADQGFMSNHANQDRTRERIELERDLATQRARLLEANATLRESENTRSAYIAETKHSLRAREAAAELKRQQGTQELAKATQRERLTVLKAPVTGTVQQLAAHTEGGVVTEAQPIMIIVPDGAHITAEVTLENKDIGFVNVNQEAEIKLETFPFTRYGTVGAIVSRVTADAVNDEKRGAIFPVTLRLNAATIAVDGKSTSLSPGMNLTAEIKTGKRRIIEFLLSPVQRASSESMRER